MSQEKWSSDPDLEEKADLESLKFIFNQAEKLLKETSASGALIVARATTFLTLLSGLLIALTSYVITHINAKDVIYPLIITATAGIIYIVPILYKLMANLRGHDYCEVGSEPEALFVSHFFSDEIKNDDERLKEFYLAEIISYQERIRLNKVTSKKRWAKLGVCFKRLLALPIVLIAVYYLSELLFELLPF